jgi:hypothetical protein
MVYLTLVALLTAVELVATYTSHVHALAWTKDQKLLIVTTSKVYEWPTGRAGTLPSKRVSTDSPSPYSITPFRLNASKTRALGNGFTLDLRTLKAKPHEIKSKAYETHASWEGDRIVETHSNGDGEFTFVRNGRRTRVAPGWYVLGVSYDHCYALASHKAPYWENSTYLLKLNPRTGAAKQLARYSKSSDDHVMLNVVESNPRTGKLLLHKTEVAADFTYPYFASPKLREIEFPTLKGVLNTSSRIDWIEGTDAWLTLCRQFFHERSGPSGENLGFDANALDLWNYKTGKLVRVAKTLFNWGPGRNSPDNRGTGESIGPYSVDWSRDRIAYVVNGPSGGRVFVLRLRL